MKVESKHKSSNVAKVFFIDDFRLGIEEEYKETIHYHRDHGLKCGNDKAVISLLFDKGICKINQNSSRAVYHVFENNNFLEIRNKFFSPVCAILNFDLINKIGVYYENECKPNSTKYASYIHYPHQHSKFCGICIEKFESYKEHIDSVKHREKTKIEGERVYKRLTGHFKSIRETIGSSYELPDPSILPKEMPIKSYSAFSSLFTSKKQEVVSIEKTRSNLKKKEKVKLKVKANQEKNKVREEQLQRKRINDEQPSSSSKSNSTIKSKDTNNCSNSTSSNINSNEQFSNDIIVDLWDTCPIDCSVDSSNPIQNSIAKPYGISILLKKLDITCHEEKSFSFQSNNA